MTGSEELFLVCDDTNNVPFDEIDLSLVPPDLLEEIDAILTGKADEPIAA